MTRFLKIERALAELDPERARAARAALLGEAPAEKVALAFARHGHTVSPSSIRTYRREQRLNGGTTR